MSEFIEGRVLKRDFFLVSAFRNTVNQRKYCLLEDTCFKITDFNIKIS